AGPGRWAGSSRASRRAMLPVAGGQAAGATSRCATWPRAWTPASVRPATVSTGSAERASAQPSACSRTCWTVRRPGWPLQPGEAEPPWGRARRRRVATRPDQGREAASEPLRAASGPCWPEPGSRDAQDPDEPGCSRLSALVGLLVVALGLVVRLGLLVCVLGVLHRVVGVLHRVVGVLHRLLDALSRLFGVGVALGLVHRVGRGGACAPRPA